MALINGLRCRSKSVAKYMISRTISNTEASTTTVIPNIYYRTQIIGRSRSISSEKSYYSTDARYQERNHEEKRKFSSKDLTWAVLSAGSLTLTVCVGAYLKYKQTKANTTTTPSIVSISGLWPRSVSAAAEEVKTAPGELKPGLPTYTLDEVSKHVSKDTGIWVIYKNGVYDITEYVDHHPGGKMILMASGKSMEPFWNKYSMHNNDAIYEMMEYFRIGNITETVNVSKSLDSDVKPWMMPEKKILNLDLGKSMTTSLSMECLKNNFEKRTIVLAIKCSSGKKELREMKWSGVTLGDLMTAQGVDLDKVENEFLVFESMQCRPDGSPFDSRFPMEMVRSLKDDILVSYEVNGEHIPPLQGHPFRLIVKGHGGGKQVKWLRRIRFSTKEEDDAS